MKEDVTLVVLAAGIGSRFGGLKQIEPVGPNGEFIIDYSIKDAIRAGFTKVVFIIKEENYPMFQETIGKRIKDQIKVEYVFQTNTDIPDGISIPKERIKPLGTAQAIYTARNIIHEKFAVINADDFYGRDAYLKAYEFLKKASALEYGNIAYEVGNTLTDNGAVKRGVIFASNSYLDNLIESSIEKIDDKIVATPLNNDQSFTIPANQLVSMNLFCLTPQIFTYLENHIQEFFTNAKDLMTCEWLLPDVALASAKENKTKIKVVKTNSVYHGITYQEDLKDLKQSILAEINQGLYRSDLWS